MFHVNFDTSADKFQNYYKDLSQRVKAREVDLLIVVNMFLTGFDATTLNTLWVDKNLKMHGLIQAFSRTNRILNSVKTYGNIVCFRNLQKATDDAIALFGDREASGVVLLKGYDAHYDGYEENGKAVPGYRDLIDELSSEFPLGQPITGEQKQKNFIKLYGNILRLKNILSAFDQFVGHEILPERDFQDYQSVYLDLYQAYRPKTDGDKENINGTLVWSGYAAGAIGLLYIVILLPMWFRHPNPVIFVPVDFIAVGLYLLYINFATGGHWFLSFAFPVTGAIGLLISAAVALTHYLRSGYLYIYGGMLILGGGLAVLIEFLINLTFQIHETLFWSFYPMVAGIVLGLMLIVIAICKPLRESLHRKFFL